MKKSLMALVAVVAMSMAMVGCGHTTVVTTPSHPAVVVTPHPAVIGGGHTTVVTGGGYGGGHTTVVTGGGYGGSHTTIVHGGGSTTVIHHP